MTININIPASWNECNTWQLRKLAHLLYSGVKGIRFDYQVLLILMQLKWYHFRKLWKLKMLLQSTTFPHLKETYNWLYQETNLTQFAPKQINSNGVVFHAPANRLSNISVDEFAHADDLFVLWHNSKNIESLHYLAAVLYAEHDHTGKRIDFDKNLLDRKAKYFQKVKPSELMAISLAYVGCRNHIAPMFPHVFPKRKSAEAPAKKSKLQSSQFGKVALHIAGGKFGSYNETKATNLYTFLHEYNELLKQAKQDAKY